MPLSKQALVVKNNTNFPNNNTGYITPALLREFNTDMIDAMQLTQSMSEYAVLSGSNTFIGTQTMTGNLNVTGVISASVLHVQYETASVIFSTGSNQFGDELIDVQTLSGSVKIQGQLLINGIPLTSGSTVDTGSLVTTASFNAYTQSTDLRLNSLETNSASVNVSISNLNTTTASLNTSITNLNQFSASQIGLNGTFATTGSNTFTGNQVIDRAYKLFTNGVYWTDMTAGFNNLEIINQGGGNLDFASLNGGRMRVVNTPLQLTGSILSSNSDISTSANVYGANLTASAIPAGTISSSAQISALGFVSSSVTASSLITASLSGQTLTFTKGDNSTFGIILPDVSGSDITALNQFTASQLLINTGYNTFTSSTNTSISSLNQFSASALVSISNINSTTASLNSSVSQLNVSSASQQISIDNLNAATSSYITESETASFARTNVDNNFTANQTFTNITAVSASFTYVQTLYETASVIYSSGSNQFGDELTDVQILSGSVEVEGSLTVNGIPVLTSSVDISGLVTTASFNTYTQSNDDKVNSLINATASYANSASVAAVDLAQQEQINSLINATSSYADSASFAASQLVQDSRLNNLETTTASLNISVNNINQFTQSAGISINSLNQFTASQSTASLVTSIDNLNQFSASALVSISNLNASSASQQISIDNLNTNSASVNTSVSNINTFTQSANISINALNAATSSYATSAITASSLITASVNLNTITFTKGDASTFAITVNTGSGGGGTTDTGSLMVTGSVNVNVLTFTKGDGSTFDLTVSASGSAPEGTVSSSAQILAYNIFATTGSNTFIGNETFQDAGGNASTLVPVSGSLMLVAKGFTSASAHLSASAGNQVNLIFKNNNNTGTTILSGSNNIFTNPSAPTAGYIRYVGGSSNLFLNGQIQQLPQITGSATSVSGNRPTMFANIINGNQGWTINQAVNTGTHTYASNILSGPGTWTFNTTGNTGTVNVNGNLGLSSFMTLNSPSRSVAQINAGESGSNALTIQNNTIAGTLNYQGPVSSSTHTIQANSIAGNLTLNVQSSSRALSAQANIINGTLTLNDNTFFAPTLGSNNTINQNNINGTTTFTNAGSSSFSILNNNFNSVTVTSFLDASALTGAAARLSTMGGNAVFGTNNSILFSGSVGAAPIGRVMSNNLMAGQFNSASLIGDGTGSNMFATAVLGGGLSVFGTTTIPAAGIFQNYGSAFFGRWNVEDGNRAKTAETIFAVGTGTSGSAGIVRKTGFLIDSGSNTFIEGTLNVSGSTSTTGSITIQSGSGDLFVHGNKQFNGAQYSSLVTQSGSAAVSQSITFDTTGPEFGVSLVDNTKLTVANSGTYNIQFSAQLLADTGADNVFIWFKKNGTNIAGSASELVIQNNDEALMTVNILDTAAASDYYELCWQSTNGDAVLLTAGASGNIPSIPSVIATITQVR